MSPKVSIITVNYNKKELLGDFFESLSRLVYPDKEVLFVDNASSDGSADFVKTNYPGVKVIKNTVNLGFSAANNKAAESAQGEYLFFLNNDTKIDSHALTSLVEEIECDANTGICGCKMLSYDGKTYFHTGIGADVFGFPVNNGKIFYAEGSALMMRKDLFKKLGGFDEKYFMFHEDVDLSWRAWLYGYRVAACDRAIVYHMFGASAGGSTKDGKYQSTIFRRYLSERNNIRTLLKNYSSCFLVLFLPFYIMLNAMEVFLFLVSGQFKVCACYPQAYLWNIKNLPDTLRERRRIQAERKISDKKIIKRMTLTVGKFFVLRKLGIPHFR